MIRKYLCNSFQLVAWIWDYSFLPNFYGLLHQPNLPKFCMRAQETSMALSVSSTATRAMSLNTESTGLNWPQLENCGRLLLLRGNYGSSDLLLCWICWIFRENTPWFNAPSCTIIYCWLCPVGRVRWCTERLSHWFSHCKKCLTLQVFKCKRSMY